MGANATQDWSVERVRAAVRNLAAAVAAVDPDVSGRLEAAADVEADAEALLVMRSELIATRAIWEKSGSPESVSEARRSIAAGKRLAIAGE